MDLAPFQTMLRLLHGSRQLSRRETRQLNGEVAPSGESREHTGTTGEWHVVRRPPDRGQAPSRWRTALVSPRLAKDVYPAALPGPDAGGVNAENVGSRSGVVEVKDQIAVRIGGAGDLRCAALDHQSLANLVRPAQR